jgi:2-hydroxychromene-2-carboxylate isomerase
VSPQTAAFYFDLADPRSYLAAEQVLQTLSGSPEPVRWQPVLAAGLGASGQHRNGVQSGPAEALDLREEIEQSARLLGLQGVVWPVPFPFDSELAMRAATYAKSIGRTVPFAQAAFRQAYAGGRALDQLDNILIAGAACEMHPRAIVAAVEMNSVAEELASTTAQAAAEGVGELPALRIGERLWTGGDALRSAAAHLAERVPR